NRFVAFRAPGSLLITPPLIRIRWIVAVDTHSPRCSNIIFSLRAPHPFSSRRFITSSSTRFGVLLGLVFGRLDLSSTPTMLPLASLHRLSHLYPVSRLIEYSWHNL